MEINDNEEDFENWLLNSVENFLTGSTISLPSDWVQVIEANKNNAWPLFTSLAINIIEKEMLNVPVSAFQFWEQKDFRSMLTEIMDKSASYGFNREEEKTEGITYFLIER